MGKIFSVYFNGTDESNDIPQWGTISLATLLNHLTVHDDIDTFSICVNGCGIDNNDIRDFKFMFTYHLQQQVIDIAKQVEELVKQNKETVTLNIYGFSRGGAAAFLLCKKLSHLSKQAVTINIASFEPVPGNFITSVHGDILLGTNCSLSAAIADLTECENIANMLVLFASEPLPDIACHAPILPALPNTCHADIDVMPGCHRGAVGFNKVNVISPWNDESAIMFHRIIEFMQKSGTKFNFDKFEYDERLKSNNDLLLSLYEKIAKKSAYLAGGQQRHMHLNNLIFTSNIPKKYLNRYHQQLSHVDNIDDKASLLTLQNRQPQKMSAEQRKKIQTIELIFVLAIMLMLVANRYLNSNTIENNTTSYRPGLQ